MLKKRIFSKVKHSFVSFLHCTVALGPWISSLLSLVKRAAIRVRGTHKLPKFNPRIQNKKLVLYTRSKKLETINYTT